jgi:hypothetical protein
MAHFLLSLFITPSLSLCSFTQHCTNPPIDCDPPLQILPPYQPFAENWTTAPACPEFKGQQVCCNDDQNQGMLYKYNLLDNTFGHLVGGCDLCSAAMKRLWCYFTCSTDQSNFVSAGPQVWVPSPIDQQPILVMLNNFTVTNSLSCEIYEACQKCPYVTEVSAMQSPQGFLEFQGYEGIPIGLLWTTFLFDDGPASLDLSFMSCSTNVTNAYGYPIVPCSCNNCQDSCAGDYYVSEPATLHGADWSIVGFFYLGLLVVSVIVLFVQFKIKKREMEESSRTSVVMREMEDSREDS